MQTAEETIIAPATAPGEGALAIVRLSGADSLQILGELFRSVDGKPTGEMPSHRLTLGSLEREGEVLDQCMAVVMRAPHSFTGEDVVEFHCHGGRAVVGAILEACISEGARIAEPGEFSKRAFLNHKLDLAQAEAVCDLISARADLSRKLALRQLQGGLSGRVSEMRARLIDAAALLEAHLDFPEEDIPEVARGRISQELSDAATQIEKMLSGFERGRVARQGARVVLAGKPNAGKSSLFNALVGRERAIVTPHPGTTRDTIESTVDLQGVAVTLIDTAGIREAFDEIERMGIERTTGEIAGADLVLHIVDAGELAREANGWPETLNRERRSIAVLNKIDLIEAETLERLRSDAAQRFDEVVALSIITRQGLEELEKSLYGSLIGEATEEELQLSSARHAACFQAALDSLSKAREAFDAELSGEFVMVDLREAIIRLGEITGERLDEQILDRIFQTFCLGK